MATLITINVTNNSPTQQNFFFFQQPAIYVGGPTVYSNSLWTSTLLPYASSGANLSFWMNLQFYAGIQQQVVPPAVGQSSGGTSASQPIGLTPAPGGTPTNNTTTMTLSGGLGLSPPVSTTGPQPGSFRIITPTYDPMLASYNAGTAVRTLTGATTLSNFITAQPMQNIDVQPILKFYVATGNYTAGTVVNFTGSSTVAASCDATPGYSTFNVSYNADGTWTVQNFALVKSLSGAPMLLQDSQASNIDILNEAGTSVIAHGYTNNPQLPMTIQNIDNPGFIHANTEYQLQPHGHQIVGAICTQIIGSTANFS